MNFLIFALLVVPAVYSYGLISEEAMEKVLLTSYDREGKVKSVTIDVKKANGQYNPYPLEYPKIVEDFFSSSTDVDRNGFPDNQQEVYVQPIIGRISHSRIHADGKPLIPNQFIEKVWDHEKGIVTFVKINGEKVHQYLGAHSSWPFYPVTVDDGKEGVVVESNNRKKRQANPFFYPSVAVEHPNYAEDYFRRSTDLNRDGQPDVTQYPYPYPYIYGVLPSYPYGAGFRTWY